MSSRIIGFQALALAAAFMPALASAQTLFKALGFLDIFMGLFLTVAICMFVGALILYFTRYGTFHREDAYPFMQSSIAIVFVLIVILALVRFLREHTTGTLYVIGAVILLFGGWLVMKVFKGEKKKQDGGNRRP